MVRGPGSFCLTSWPDGGKTFRSWILLALVSGPRRVRPFLSPSPPPFGCPRRCGAAAVGHTPVHGRSGLSRTSLFARPPVTASARRLPGARKGLTHLGPAELARLESPMGVRGSGPVGRSRETTECRRMSGRDAAKGPPEQDAFRAGRRNDRGTRAAQRSWAKSRTGSPYPHRACYRCQVSRLGDGKGITRLGPEGLTAIGLEAKESGGLQRRQLQRLA